jgi:hypothetical protein
MAGLVAPTRLPDLMRAAPDGTEGDVYLSQVWTCAVDEEEGLRPSVGSLGSYTPSDGDAPRLVARVSCGRLGVWDTGSGEFLRVLQGSRPEQAVTSFLAYQRPSDGAPRVAAVEGDRLHLWNGDDFQVLHILPMHADAHTQIVMMVYEEPTGRWTRLVTG